MKEIYLDNAATTKTLEESAKLMLSIMTEEYGNPSSIHRKGFAAEKHIKKAREIVAGVLDCEPKEIIFTSGGTESDNLAIIGAARANKRKNKHIVTSSIEHSAVSGAMKYLEEKEGFEITCVPCNENGTVNPESIKEAIHEDTILVSVMYVNNETGSLQPIKEIEKIIRFAGDNIIFHVDATQAVGKYRINLKNSRIDLLTGSSHKFHGPKGAGFLYRRDGIKLEPVIIGGGQESGFRSGTENVAGIAGMANSLLYMSDNLDESYNRVSDLKKDFINKISDIEEVYINGGGNGSPYIVNVSFAGIKGEVLVHALEDRSIYASTSSACSSRSSKPSPVLSSMGLSPERMDSAVRFSFSIDTKKEEIESAAEALRELVPVLLRFKQV